MNLQQLTEQFRQELLQSAADNYAAQLKAQKEAYERMRQQTEAAYHTHIAAINARFGGDDQTPEISDLTD